MSRLNQLEQFYQDDPNDPFNLYALALEYLSSNRSKSKIFFDKLLTEHPHYLATYYHAAKFYQDLDQRQRAIEIYEQGIALARNQANHKALRELQSAYDELVYE